MEKFTGQNYLFTFTINGYGPGEANLGGTTTQTFQNPKWLYQIESFFQPCLPVYAKLHFLKIYRTEQNFTGLVLRSADFGKSATAHPGKDPSQI